MKKGKSRPFTAPRPSKPVETGHRKDNAEWGKRMERQLQQIEKRQTIVEANVHTSDDEDLPIAYFLGTERNGKGIKMMSEREADVSANRIRRELDVSASNILPERTISAPDKTPLQWLESGLKSRTHEKRGWLKEKLLKHGLMEPSNEALWQRVMSDYKCQLSAIESMRLALGTSFNDPRDYKGNQGDGASLYL
jgi:hypothetical protein